MSTNPRTLFTIGLLSSVSLAAISAPLSEYRACLGLKEEGPKAAARIGRIRQALGTESLRVPSLAASPLPAPFLAANPKPRTPPRRQSYSNYFRQVMQEAADELHIDLRYWTPRGFDPSQSVDEYRSALAEAREASVLKSLLSKSRFSVAAAPVAGAKPVKVWGMEAVLTDLLTFTVASQKSRAEPWTLIPPPELAVRDRLKTYLDAAPRNPDGQSVTDVLGRLHDLEFREGMLDEVHFTDPKAGFGPAFMPGTPSGMVMKNGKLSTPDVLDYYANPISDRQKISLSLDMLLGLRTGKEDAFVEVQRVLVGYLDRQRETLARRRASLKDPLRDVKRLASTFIKANQMLVTHQSEVIGWFAGDRAKAEASMAQALAEMMASEPDQILAKETERFLEGRVKLDSEQELPFIERRLAQIDLVYGTMKAKLEGTYEAHRKLSKLSASQVAYLVDFFLQTKGSEVMTRKESSNLAAYFSNAGSCVKTASSADYPYFRNTARLLDELEETLRVDHARELADEEDLRQIRAGG
jgi:hypothetical protein